MSGSTFGTIFRLTTWGESHGYGIGAVIDGCPSGLALSEKDIQPFMDRRRPGGTIYSTPRKEDDLVTIQSGVFEGYTTGTPISIVLENNQHASSAYNNLKDCYRPGHADYTFDMKYGFRDYRGGGRSSGRETAARVAGGAVAMKLLASLGITIAAYTKSIGPITSDESRSCLENIRKSPLYMPDPIASAEAEKYLKACMEAGDSAGGIIECRVNGLPAGVGEPVFNKLDAELAKAIMSIGAVKGFEIGSGFASASNCGSQNNDSFIPGQDRKLMKESNNSGGVLGGISDGDELIFRAAIKPTPSIKLTQQTVNKDGEQIELSIGGRHDPVIVPRAVVVVEAMAALTIADMLLMNMTSKLSSVQQFYR